MPYQFKKATGTATSSGQEVYTVPSENTISIIGCRVSNKDPIKPHQFHITINDILVSGLNTPLPIGSAIDIIVGSKIIAEPGSIIKAYSDEDDVVDIYISYLEQ